MLRWQRSRKGEKIAKMNWTAICCVRCSTKWMSTAAEPSLCLSCQRTSVAWMIECEISGAKHSIRCVLPFMHTAFGMSHVHSPPALLNCHGCFQDLAACEVREKELEKQAQHQKQFHIDQSASEDMDIVGRYTVTLRGCDAPRLAYGVRGGLIAVVTAPLNQHAKVAGIKPGDELIAVDGVPIANSQGSKGLEAAAIQRMQGLRGRRAVSWLLRRPPRATLVHSLTPTRLSRSSSPSSSSSTTSSDMDTPMLQMSEQERRLMGALRNSSAE